MQKKKIAITGGIGTGKSFAGNILREMGYPVFSCDEIYKNISKNEEYIEKIEKLFPDVVENKEINRKKLADFIFSDDEKRKLLNDVAHPLIIKELIKKMEEETSRLIFAEVPLLFEENFEYLFDRVLVVKRTKENRIRAVIKRDNTDRKSVEKRMRTQFDYEAEENQTRLQNSNALYLENNGDKNRLKEQIENMLSKL